MTQAGQPAHMDTNIAVFFDCTVGIVQAAWDVAKGEKGKTNENSNRKIDISIATNLSLEKKPQVGLCLCEKERVHGVKRVYLPHTSG